MGEGKFRIAGTPTTFPVRTVAKVLHCPERALGSVDDESRPIYGRDRSLRYCKATRSLLSEIWLLDGCHHASQFMIDIILERPSPETTPLQRCLALNSGGKFSKQTSRLTAFVLVLFWLLV